MGCGYGAKIHVYEVKPESLPQGKTKEHVRFLTRDDWPALTDCYNRYVDRTTGAIEDTTLAREIFLTFLDQFTGAKCVGLEADGRLIGYLIFTFKKGPTESFVDNNIEILEMVYEDSQVFLELMRFLHTQLDQISLVMITTTDDNFHYVLEDPRRQGGRLILPIYHESHTSGVGIMYRVLDTRGIFETLRDHDFGGSTCKLKLSVVDSFIPENNGSIVIHFTDGTPHVQADGSGFEVELGMDISDFSSMLLGAVDLRSLYGYGLAELSDPAYVDRLNGLFATEGKPVCLTWF